MWTLRAADDDWVSASASKNFVKPAPRATQSNRDLDHWSSPKRKKVQNVDY
jgi:hypothetical protein